MTTLNYNLSACCGLFAFVAGNHKSRGIVLVELMELHPENSATSFLWIFSLSQLINRMSGMSSVFCFSKSSQNPTVLQLIAILGCFYIDTYSYCGVFNSNIKKSDTVY